jgi:hypothetical protein
VDLYGSRSSAGTYRGLDYRTAEIWQSAISTSYSPGVTDADGDRRDERNLLPLQTLGQVVTGLLAGDIALAAARLIVPLIDRSASSWHIQIDVKPVVVLSRVVLVLSAIAFLVWFRRARINAEDSGWRQRRARAWVFWGWVIPVADLWIPFQMMGDIWRAGRPPGQRAKVAWLPAAWWVSWLLAELTAPLQTGMHGSPARHALQLPHNWTSLCLFATAGTTLIAIIQIVSSGPVGTAEAHAADYELEARGTCAG